MIAAADGDLWRLPIRSLAKQAQAQLQTGTRFAECKAAQYHDVTRANDDPIGPIGAMIVGRHLHHHVLQRQGAAAVEQLHAKLHLHCNGVGMRAQLGRRPLPVAAIGNT